MTRMRVGTKIDTISIYLSWNWVNQITISKIYQQRTLQEGTIVTSWGPENTNFFKKDVKNLDFIKSQNSNRYNKSAAICDDFGGTKYE